MPKNLLLFFLITMKFNGFAQQNSNLIIGKSYYGNTINEREICDLVAFSSRPEVSMAVEKIVKRSGLKQNFYVMECPNTENCFAATRNGERLIVYDPDFIGKLSDATRTDWAAMSILAHEIGHHLQGHTIKSGGSEHEKELEADEFAGFVMYQLGATLKEAQSAISTLTTEYTTSTHPARGQRLKAIERGYKNAKELYPGIKSDLKQEKQDETIADRTENIVIETEVVDAPKRTKGCIEGTCFEGYGEAINSKTNEKYAGEWHMGKRSGKGKEYYKDGKIKYEGNFVNGVYSGQGKYYFKNGEKYSGSFVNGIMHGQKSTFSLRNGDRVIVDYIQGKKEGKAKIIYYGGVEGTAYYKNDKEIR